MNSTHKYHPLLICLLLIGALAGVLSSAPQLHAAPQIIYDDALAAGWQNWSWATVALDNTNPVHAGSHSISVDYGGWDGFYLAAPGGISTLGFTKVRFFVHGGTTGGQPMNLHATLEGGQNGPDITVPAPTANTWTEVQISLAALGAENSAITALVWQEGAGGNHAPLYIDDIALIGDESPDGPVLSDRVIFPAAAPADGVTEVVVRVRVTDPQGAADVVSVTLDGSALGRGTIPLYDDGLHNDAAAQDGLYGARFTVAPGTPSGEPLLLVTAEDQAQHRASLQLGGFAILDTPGGSVPAPLPQTLGWGTNAWDYALETDWQVQSGVPWNYVYQYITYGWDHGGWGENFVGRFVTQAWGKDYIPVISVYLLLHLPPTCGEGAECYAQKLQNAAAVTEFLGSIEEAARQAQGEDPVIFHLEPDFTGFMQQYTNGAELPPGVRVDDPTSFPVALNKPGYANDLTGFGKYIVDLIHTTAPNALVAHHASTWSTNRDPNRVTPSEVITMGQRTAAFITAMGGAEADLLFVEWSDDDAGRGVRPWWDDTNLTLPRPNRAVLWENALSAASNKRLILWQIPVGNINLPNDACNRYQDNRVNYISYHPRDLIDAGIVGLLFGGGQGCSTRPDTDDGFLAAQGGIAYALPAAPTALTGDVNGSSVLLRWNENSEPDIWGYRVVYQRPGSGAPTSLDVRRANATTLAPGGGTWEIQVAAYDAMGQVGPLSAPITVTLGCFDFVAPEGVWIEDVQAVASRWNQNITTPHDTDGDGTITTLDLTRVAQSWATFCQ